MSPPFSLFLSFSLILFVHCQQQTHRQTLPQPPESIFQYLQPELIDQHLEFLSLQALQGRAPGTNGERAAAKYLEKHLSSYKNLIGGAEDGGFLQTVPLVGSTVTSASNLFFNQPKTQKQLVFSYSTDFTVGGDFINSSTTVEQLQNEDLVFVGYGIDAPDYDWDDYKGVDVSGKVLVMFVSQPDIGKFAGQSLTYYGRWTYKFEEARAKKARGAILIHTDETAGYPWSVVQSGWAGEVVDSAQQVDNPLVITSWMTSSTADSLFGLYGTDLDTMFQVADSSTFSPIPLGIQVSLSFNSTHRKFDGVNVLALLPGKDTENVVVFSGHLDHLGVKGGQVYPGAIDNASGASMVLNLALAFANLNETLERSILFFFPTAEESGLIGSEYYATSPRSKTVISCINFDIGDVWGKTEDLTILGQSKSTLGDLFEDCAGQEGLYLSPDPAPTTGLFYRSDHFSFAKVGVPDVWIYTGSHFVGQPDTYYNTTVQEGYFNTIYHTPQDAYREDYNYDGVIQQLRVAIRVGYGLAESQVNPYCFTTCT